MTVDYAKHRGILLRMLKDFYTDTSIAPYLGFKGGTAAHLFYGLNRDSFDLDFDLLDDSKKEEAFEKSRKVALRYGKLIDSRIKRFNLFNAISYDDRSQNIKIEINRRDFNSKYEIKTLLGISMQVIKQEDMFAHKLIAMLERISRTKRDLYDVWFFLNNNWAINKEIVESRSGMTFKDTLQRCIDEVERVKKQELLLGLGESLTDSQKDWARAKLKEEVIFLLKVRMREEE